MTFLMRPIPDYSPDRSLHREGPYMPLAILRYSLTGIGGWALRLSASLN
jgi:hypothetical protein